MNPVVPVPPLEVPLSESAIAVTLVLLLLAPLSIAGLALITTGLGRSRSAAQALLGNLANVAVAAIVFALVGEGLAGNLSGLSHAIHLAGTPWNWTGAGPLFLHGFSSASMQRQLEVLFEFLAVLLAVLIPWGSGADRLRLAAGCAVSVLLAGFFFPLVAHWVWGGGWLAALGLHFGLGAGFLDAGGAAPVHALGGLSALALVWTVGARRGKFPREGLSTAMPGHHVVYVLFGCLLYLVGWLAWNAAGAILWLNAPFTTLPRNALDTVLSASAALLATLAVTRFRFGKPDASMCANGWLAGLVASSACAAIVTPGESLFIGAVAGIITPLLVEVLELALSVDDPSGAIAVHAVAALWGIFAVGLFAPQSGQLLAQVIGIAALLGLVLPCVYLLFFLLNRIVPLRVDPDGERIGMDLHELGGGAYPEFVIHRDDSYR